MGVSNDDEDSDGVNGYGFGGNYPLRQGAEAEIYVPRNLSLMAAELRNFSWMETDSLRVFASGAIYRRKGDVGGRPGGPHHT